MLTCASCNKQSDKMLICGSCKSANYCNRECQVHHWKHGGHKKACGLPTSLDDTSKPHRHTHRHSLTPSQKPSHRHNPSSIQSQTHELGGPKYIATHTQIPSHTRTNIQTHTHKITDHYIPPHYHTPSHSNLAPSTSAPTNISFSTPKQPSDEEEPENPCPICLEREDIFGDRGICLACGQMFCENCKARTHKLANCPTCRAPFQNNPKTDFKNCYALVHVRSVGRHTPVAQNELGRMYREGIGVKKNDAKAFEYHKLAADQGHAHGLYQIGLFYQRGKGVEQNYAKAIESLQLAIDQGFAAALCSLGTMYLQGYGLEQSTAKAIEYYHLAAEKGFAHAQYNLATMYINGRDSGTEDTHRKACISALAWFKLAALQKMAEAQSALAKAFFPPGTRVQIEGLTSKSSLNGSFGTVLKHRNPEQCSMTVDGRKKAMPMPYNNLIEVDV